MSRFHRTQQHITERDTDRSDVQAKCFSGTRSRTPSYGYRRWRLNNAHVPRQPALFDRASRNLRKIPRFQYGRSSDQTWGKSPDSSVAAGPIKPGENPQVSSADLSPAPQPACSPPRYLRTAAPDGRDRCGAPCMLHAKAASGASAGWTEPAPHDHTSRPSVGNDLIVGAFGESSD